MIDLNRISKIVERLDWIDDVFNRQWMYSGLPTDCTGFWSLLFDESQCLMELVVNQAF